MSPRIPPRNFSSDLGGRRHDEEKRRGKFTTPIAMNMIQNSYFPKGFQDISTTRQCTSYPWAAHDSQPLLQKTRMDISLNKILCRSVPNACVGQAIFSQNSVNWRGLLVKARHSSKNGADNRVLAHPRKQCQKHPAFK